MRHITQQTSDRVWKQVSVYTRAEIKRAWSTDGWGHKNAISGRDCYCTKVTEEEAVDLSALFVRFIYSIPTCTYYDGNILSLWYETVPGPKDLVKARVMNLVDDYRTGTILLGSIPLFEEEMV